MEDEFILLKIKREFTTNEAVQSLLKIISALEMEIGVLKSEVSEARDKAERIRQERTLTKRQWMEEEIFLHLSQELKIQTRKNTEHSKSAADWRNKYFSLLAKTGGQ